jgi:Mrp family chromosome partitioning ATPase
LANVCFDVPVWTPEAADTEADQNEDAEAKQGEAEANTKPDEGEANTKPDAEPPLPFINIAAWHNAPTPEREWVVRDRVPLAAVTLMSGEGGVGKTILALHLAVATALAATGPMLCRRLARHSSCAARTTPTSCTAGLIE